MSQGRASQDAEDALQREACDLFGLSPPSTPKKPAKPLPSSSPPPPPPLLPSPSPAPLARGQFKPRSDASKPVPPLVPAASLPPEQGEAGRLKRGRDALQAASPSSTLPASSSSSSSPFPKAPSSSPKEPKVSLSQDPPASKLPPPSPLPAPSPEASREKGKKVKDEMEMEEEKEEEAAALREIAALEKDRTREAKAKRKEEKRKPKESRSSPFDLSSPPPSASPRPSSARVVLGGPQSSPDPLLAWIEEQFTTGSTKPPRPHQSATLEKILRELLAQDPSLPSPLLEDSPLPEEIAELERVREHNFLIQHAAGSGKSLTIACLVYLLSQLQIVSPQDPSIPYWPRFDLIVIINDRLQLDDQLTGTCLSFLQRMKKSSAASLRFTFKQAQDVKGLEKLLTKPPTGKTRIVSTTLQKLALLLKPETVRRKRVAIVADECHRSHGHESTKILHAFLAGETRQHADLTYFSFTGTPSSQALSMFGREHGGDMVPFYTYSLDQAVKEGMILNVLEDYTTVGSLVNYEVPDEVQRTLGLTLRSGLYRLGELQREDERLLRLKVGYALRHFLDHKRTFSNPATGYFPKALFVCSSRRLLLRYKKEFDRQLQQLPAAERFEAVAVFSPVEQDGELYQETDVAINGPRWAAYKPQRSTETDGPVAAFVEAPEVQIALVAEKLRTGFDFPLLGALYVDVAMDGNHAVQTLGRLSRTYPGKKGVQVVDFANSRATISRAFAKFWGTTTMHTIKRVGTHVLFRDLEHATVQLREVLDNLPDGAPVELVVQAIREKEAVELKDNATTTRALTRKALARFVTICDQFQLDSWDQISCKVMKEILQLLNARSPQELQDVEATRAALRAVEIKVDGLQVLKGGALHPEEHAYTAYSLRSLRAVNPHSYYIEALAAHASVSEIARLANDQSEESLLQLASEHLTLARLDQSLVDAAKTRRPENFHWEAVPAPIREALWVESNGDIRRSNQRRPSPEAPAPTPKKTPPPSLNQIVSALAMAHMQERALYDLQRHLKGDYVFKLDEEGDKAGRKLAPLERLLVKAAEPCVAYVGTALDTLSSNPNPDALLPISSVNHALIILSHTLALPALAELLGRLSIEGLLVRLLKACTRTGQFTELDESVYKLLQLVAQHDRVNFLLLANALPVLSALLDKSLARVKTHLDGEVEQAGKEADEEPDMAHSPSEVAVVLHTLEALRSILATPHSVSTFLRLTPRPPLALLFRSLSPTHPKSLLSFLDHLASHAESSLPDLFDPLRPFAESLRRHSRSLSLPGISLLLERFQPLRHSPGHPAPVSALSLPQQLEKSTPSNACRFGLECRFPDCHYSHPPGWKPRQGPAPPPPCRLAADCKKPGCTFSHPDGWKPPSQDQPPSPSPSSPRLPTRPNCWFGVDCRRLECPFAHPSGRTAFPGEVGMPPREEKERDKGREGRKRREDDERRSDDERRKRRREEEERKEKRDRKEEREEKRPRKEEREEKRPWKEEREEKRPRKEEKEKRPEVNRMEEKQKRTGDKAKDERGEAKKQPEKLVPCPDCDRRFNNERDHQQHWDRVHGPNKPTPKQPGEQKSESESSQGKSKPRSSLSLASNSLPRPEDPPQGLKRAREEDPDEPNPSPSKKTKPE